jgi:acyl-CoA synthetase (AMP-forming)/AMP-acid ligase II
MIRLLQKAAESAPGRPAVITSEASVSYGELLEDASRVATALRRRNVTRLAIVEADAAWTIRLLAGAAIVGAEPCQYQPDTDPDEFAQQAEALGHSVVVTRRSDLARAFEVVEPGELTKEPPDATVPASDPQPLLIRTTGTTGRPKAARHDWQVLARTVAGVRPAPQERWLLAYGPHQFAGIQVLLHVVASQATLVAPFPRQPKNGLEAMVGHGVTCVSATPTYWRFLLTEARSRKVGLPPLRQVTLGGEASSADLLEELRRCFPEARIAQVYASTEFGSVTSVSDGLPGIAVGALFGESNPTANLRVQDGELWVRPEAGMSGYASESGGDPTGADAEGWRATGDLVEIVGGRVLFRGRKSEVINVGGVKVHPLPVEERIAALDTVAAARVFGRANRLTGSIVAAEVVPQAGTAPADLDRIRAQIKAAVADLPPAWHPRSIAFVDSIETTGGKTARGFEA